MKAYPKSVTLAFFVAALLAACESKTASTRVDGSEFPEVPANAIKEPYPGTTDLVKISINYTTGSLKEQGDYYMGMRDGAWTEYHTNGWPKTVTSYVNGQKHGAWMSLDERGQLQEKGFYFNDQMHGDYVKYNRTRIKEEMFYNEGKLEGVVRKYYPNGTLMEESQYENGNLNGVSKWFDQDGNLKFEYEYRDNELVSQGQ